MLISLNSDGLRVLGSEATKEGEYYCQQCGRRVIPKKGDIKIHHFAHYPGSPSCEWWEPETEEHLLMKQEIIEIINRDNNTVLAEPEYKLNLNGNTLFPDVYLELGDGKRIAIECQVSNKPLSDFIEKTRQYSDSGIYTLWIFPFGDYSNKYNIIPAIQCQSHTWNFGRVYLLETGRKKIIGAHFKGVCKRTIEYNKDDVEFSSGGFYYKNGTHYKVDSYWDWGETFGFEVDWRPRMPKETSLRIANKNSLLCIENDDIKIARFNDRKWW